MRALRLLVPIVAVLAVLMLVVGLGFVVLGGGGSQSGCDGAIGPAGSTGLGRSGPIDPAQLSAEQRENAALIVGVATSMGLPPRASQVALATAMQESTLRNLDYGDRDSLGLFQQRPSQGWGTPAQVTDPVYAASTFLDRLLKVPGWEQLPVTMAAQTVQRSAFPQAYAKWEGLAAQLVSQLAGVADFAGCVFSGALLPAGVVRTAVTFAIGEIGKPHLWGGTGPNAYDCSGLMMRAYEAAGINLPRVSRDQYNAVAHVRVSDAQSGDLLFLATDQTDPSTIHHVMLYVGDGQIVEAPYRGQPLRVRSIGWDEPELVPLATRPGTTPNRA